MIYSTEKFSALPSTRTSNREIPLVMVYYWRPFILAELPVLEDKINLFGMNNVNKKWNCDRADCDSASIEQAAGSAPSYAELLEKFPTKEDMKTEINNAIEFHIWKLFDQTTTVEPRLANVEAKIRSLEESMEAGSSTSTENVFEEINKRSRDQKM
ncbi:hypothetical protein J6590_009585 [Homalodisca vitripennis]|nr:hypothetical protein J6590_009585 [Homalodisca vitripennis]